MVKLHEYLTYRGREGQWAWILHRVTGVGIFIYLVVHIVDTALIGWGPPHFNKMMALYRHPVFRLGEIVLGGTVLLHVLNGIRVIIIDFWPAATVVQRKLFYGVLAVFAAIYIPVAIYMLQEILK